MCYIIKYMSVEESGLKSFAANIKRRLFKEKSSEIKLNPEEIKGYVDLGLSLIRQKQYCDAIEHFQNEQIARSLGLKTDYPMIYPLETLPSPDELDSQIDEWASHCSSDPLKICEVDASCIPRSELNNPQSQETLILIYQNLSLLGAEEWIHSLQKASGHLLVDPRHAEIDVAAYLLHKGIPLTPQFLKRYQRGKYLNDPKLQPPDILLSQHDPAS